MVTTTVRRLGSFSSRAAVICTCAPRAHTLATLRPLCRLVQSRSSRPVVKKDTRARNRDTTVYLLADNTCGEAVVPCTDEQSAWPSS